MVLENILENLISWMISHGIKVLAILIGASIAIRFVKTFILGFLKNLAKNGIKLGKIESKFEEKRLETLEKVCFTLLKVVIWLIALIIILPEFGVEIAPLLAGIGVGGLALGFGARSLIQDYLSGIFILLEDQYRVGEEIEISGTKGRVKDFNLRITTIIDTENTLHYIPNSQIKKASNFSRK